MIFWSIYIIGFIIMLVWIHHEIFKDGSKAYGIPWCAAISWPIVVPIAFVWWSYEKLQEIYDNGGWKEFFKDDEDG